MREKDLRQKVRASSTLRPIPFRKRPYWRRPLCRSFFSLPRRVVCSCRMHMGKYWTRSSITAAVKLAPLRVVAVMLVLYSGAAKPRERWSRTGMRRSSSSSLGRARAVSYIDIVSGLFLTQQESKHTSSAFSNLAVNSAITNENCCDSGTYAFPPRISTFL